MVKAVGDANFLQSPAYCRPLLSGLISVLQSRAFKFCPFCSLMFKHVCFHVKLLTSFTFHPFAQECPFAYDKKLLLLLKQSSYARLT